MDAITLLKNDHKSVEKLFKRFEKAGKNAYVEKREVVDRIIEELSTHAAVEEQLFYPVARATVPDTDAITLESLEEHHIVKWVLSELSKMEPDDERFVAKVTVLIENVRHHIEEEEQELFPKVRDELGRNALNDLGDALESAKQFAPTSPHPKAPDAPPANLVVGAAAGVADRIGDTVSGLAQGSVSAVADLIAVILQRKRPKASPTGSRTARRTAVKAREDIDEAAERVIDTARQGKRTAERTADRTKATSKRTATAARRGAKRTARTASSAVKSTTTTAKRGAKQTGAAAKRGATSTSNAAKRSAKTTAAAAKRGSRKTTTAAKRSRSAA